MKINFSEIKQKFKDKNIGKYTWIAIPFEDYLSLGKSIEEVGFSCVWVSIEDDKDCINMEYSENGMSFNLYSDWCVEVDSKGKIKGKGSTRHKEEIQKSLNWVVKAICDDKYSDMFKYSPY